MFLDGLRLRRDDGVPLHRQIADAILADVSTGRLQPGARLPASRDLARELGVNRGTVQKAYDLLVSAGEARARVGQGTFISGSPPAVSAAALRGRPGRAGTAVGSPGGGLPFAFDPRAAEDPDWQRLSRWSARPGVISLAGGVPDARLFPVEPFQECLNAALNEEGASLLQYGASRGHAGFLGFLGRHLRRRGLSIGPGQILVVSGSQQGLDLIGRALIAPGDAVVVEDPTYSGALALFRMLGARLLPVPMDDDGLDVEHLSGLLARERPRLVYTIPTFHNPTGQTLSRARRARLLEVCGAAGVPVVEDDSDGELRFEGSEQPPLAALPQAHGVIYMGTFSKLFFPGLRLGWVVADGPVIQRLEATKRVTDLHTPPLLQAAMARFAESEVCGVICDEVRTRYRARRDVMLATLEETMPEGTRWTRPDGGLSLMVDLPGGLDAGDLLPRAVDEGVVFAPGRLFSPGRTGSHRLRLTYGSVEEDEIATGVSRLAAAVRHEMQGQASGSRTVVSAPPLV